MERGVGMAVYVLVHGAFAGGWQLRGVASLLRAAGHDAYTPALTGLGERAHLLGPDVGLDTHMRDILGVLTDEDLRDVILLGKSYAGLVITGVAEQAPDRLRHLVYLDALVPHDGQTMLDILGPEGAGRWRQIAHQRGDGWRLPVDKTADPRLTDHPFKTFTQPVEVKNPVAAAIPRTYIRCTGGPDTPSSRLTAEAAARARAEGWRCWELPTGHDPERDAPEAVVELLLRLA